MGWVHNLVDDGVGKVPLASSSGARAHCMGSSSVYRTRAEHVCWRPIESFERDFANHSVYLSDDRFPDHGVAPGLRGPRGGHLTFCVEGALSTDGTDEKRRLPA